MAPITHAAKRFIKDHPIWQGKLTTSSVQLIAMVVSDAGLASAEPQWWNASPLGCFLIGLQPRGGWQVFQRAVQWGHDRLASVFGVDCPEPVLYAYFACSMRNRIEVWNSQFWSSPTEGVKAGENWKAVRDSDVKRPTKLIDGSRGGQGFICGLLRPKEGDHYAIVHQARMQMLSVMLVAAGFMDHDRVNDFKEVMRDDFEVGDRLGIVFNRMLVGLAITSLLSIGLDIVVFYSLFRNNLLGNSAPYIIQLCSFFSWAVGAISLLMLGGNPRVKIVKHVIPAHIQSRLKILQKGNVAKGNVATDNEEGNKGVQKTREGIEETNRELVEETNGEGVEGTNGGVEETNKEEVEEFDKEIKIRLDFGSIHGSVYTPDRGHNVLPFHVVETICGWDLKLQRPMGWMIGFLLSSVMLLMSVTLQIVGSQVITVGSQVLATVLLLLLALVRGYGISGPEEWMIPQRKLRPGTSYGTSLLGRFFSRKSSQGRNDVEGNFGKD